jgi:hypothetical protein
MEIPSKVSIFNKTLEVKGKVGKLIAVSEAGYYELTMEVNQKNHLVLLPISDTVLIFNEPVPETASIDIER